MDYAITGKFYVQSADCANINFEPWFGLAVRRWCSRVPSQAYIRQLWQTLLLDITETCLCLLLLLT